MHMTKFLSALFLFISLCSISQTGKITGKIIDAKTGETLPGATAVIEGTTKGVSTDFDGNFSINNVPAGKVNLVFSYISYDSKKFTDVEVKANDVTNINVQLEPSSSTTFSEVVIVVEMIKENNAALTMMQKNNISVSDGISAEAIKRTPDKSTSDVLKRVSGASIQDNKFAIIRGLNERYNIAYINGAPLPSSESDRKAFSFDIFPSNMLDNIIITKTARPDLPGEFAGGIIEINTKSIPDKNFISFTGGGGYNTITTGKEQVYYKGGKTDWLGIDDGTRALPSGIPEYGSFSNDIHKNAQLAQEVNTGDWRIYKKKFNPNTSFQISGGYNVKRKDRDFFGVLASITYNKSNSFFTTKRNTYDNSPSVDIPSLQVRDYLDKTYSEQTLAGALLNLSCKLNENHSISLKNLLSVNSDDRMLRRDGSTNLAESNPSIIKSHTFFFTTNRIFSSQLIGDHYLPKPKLKITWIGSYSDVKREIPNLRSIIYTRFKTFNDPNDPNPLDTVYQANMSGSVVGPAYSGGMFWSTNTEAVKSFKADVSRLLKFNEDFKTDIKIGGFVQKRNRSFKSRQLGYTTYGQAGQAYQFKDSLLYLSENDIYSQQNMGALYPGAGGFKLKDATKNSDRYLASSNLIAGYLMFNSSYKDWVRLVFGARVESYNQTLNAKRDTGDTLSTDSTVVDILPSVNLIFSITQKQNIRLSYSKTINRPEFREIAPFAFYDFNTQYVFQGNDTVQRSIIHNYDLRYELFPGRGQLASASVFYKQFKNPIEQVLLTGNGNNDELAYSNALGAINYGFEIEYRVIPGALLKMDSCKFLNNLSLFTNFAYVVSKVDLSNVTGAENRPLQGQSPYVVNGGISYIDNDYGFSISAVYNRVGRRIYFVGNVREPSLWEEGRNVLDFQFTKSFFKNKLDLRFTIKDALAKKQPQYFYQNNVAGKSEKLEKGIDDMIWVNTFGTTYSFQLSFKF
jgi:hypothetical protein